LRPRLGVTVMPSLLLYATGGLAYGQVASTTTLAVPGAPACSNNLCGGGSSSQTRVGWTLGGGTEYALTEQWSVKAEYLFMDLGHENYFVSSSLPGAPPFGMQAAATFRENIARAGVNYRF
jgi:outer membrane immunogenic protein